MVGRTEAGRDRREGDGELSLAARDTKVAMVLKQVGGSAKYVSKFPVFELVTKYV